MNRLDGNIRNLAVIAHDLKAPLSAIVDLLSVLEKGYVDDPEKVREFISRAKKKSEQLIRVVEDILDYAVLENKSLLKREQLKVFDIIEESYSTIEPLARQKKVAINFSRTPCCEKFIFGNYTFLLRALNNILMNAVKYNRENGSVDIRCFCRYDKDVVIEISDTGIGISEDDIKQVFNIFVRGKEARKNIDGSLGLGLSLVRQIIKDHEGSISIESTVGVGTTITIKLPVMS